MKTLGMKVENIGFLIDRLGRDCDPLQYLRELTQNSIEAIISAGRPDGRIVWDFVEQNGVRKLCIIDNGVGMAGDQLIRYINSLSSSGSVQGMDANIQNIPIFIKESNRFLWFSVNIDRF